MLENHLLICVTHFQGEFSGILEMRQAMGHPFCPSRVLHPFLDDPVIREAIVQSVKSAAERENVARGVTVSPLSLGALGKCYLNRAGPLDIATPAGLSPIYRELVKPKDAERYWNIRPASPARKIVPLVMVRGQRGCDPPAVRKRKEVDELVYTVSLESGCLIAKKHVSLRV